MKITRINTKEFNNLLEMISGAIPTKSDNPALLGLNLKVEEDKITMLGSDGNLAIKEVIVKDNLNFEVEENGKALFDYKMFKTIINKIPYDCISLETLGNELIIETNNEKYKLPLIDDTTYPNIEFKKIDNTVEINTSHFKTILTKVALSCAVNEKKPILMGVNFEIKGNRLKCVATDSYRLSKYDIELENENVKEMSFTISKQSLTALDKIISKTKENQIKILYNETNEIVINVKNCLFKTRLLEGVYPDTSKIIPSSSDKEITISANELLNVADRISIFKTKEMTNLVIMDFKEDKELIITNQDCGYGVGTSKLKYESWNNEILLKLAVNSDYLINALKTFENEKVVIRLQSEFKPFTITDDNSNLTQLLLPMKISE